MVLANQNILNTRRIYTKSKLHSKKDKYHVTMIPI